MSAHDKESDCHHRLPSSLRPGVPQTRPHAPQCIELSAVCNSKNSASTGFVNLFGFWNRIRRAHGRTHFCAWLFSHFCNRPATGRRSHTKFILHNQCFSPTPRGPPFPLRAGPCRIFPQPSRITSGCAIRFSHFCATPRHLSSSPGASDESWSQAGGRGRLTCLSSRCLSSCLFFPPVPVTSKRAGSPDLVRRRNARTDSCAVSKPLH